MKKQLLFFLICAMVLVPFFGFAGSKQEAETQPASGAFKVAFVYIGPPGDLGWTYEHERGRMMMQEKLGDRVQSTYIESVPEGPDAARVIRQYAQQGYDMIFATSFGYMDSMYEVAQEFPNIYFEHCSGYKTAKNMSTYFGRMYQPRYLSGIVAGRMTKKNAIGYVAAFPIPEVIRGINAFTLGVRSVNPRAEVRVVWTNTWYDPVKEREAAVALLDQGVDSDLVRPGERERGRRSPARRGLRRHRSAPGHHRTSEGGPGTGRAEHRVRLGHAKVRRRQRAREPCLELGELLHRHHPECPERDVDDPSVLGRVERRDRHPLGAQPEGSERDTGCSGGREKEDNGRGLGRVLRPHTGSVGKNGCSRRLVPERRADAQHELLREGRGWDYTGTLISRESSFPFTFFTTLPLAERR
jgi:hypothetical protein